MRRVLIAFALLLLLHPTARADEPADWEDDAFLAEALDKACSYVELVCNAKFPERPKLVKTDTKQLAAILEKEMTGIFKKFGAETEAGARNMAKALAGALAAKYEPATKTIHISPANIRRVMKLIDRPELLTKDMVRAMVLHEAAHALDFMRFPSLETERQTRDAQEGIQVVGAVLEGHAQFVAEEAAKLAKLEDGFTAFTTMILSPRKTDDPAERIASDVFSSEVRFSYAKGHAFVREVYKARGRKGLDAMLASPPETIRQIEHPLVYLDPASDTMTKFDFDPALEKAKTVLEAEGLKARQQRFMATALRSVYGPLGDERADAIIKRYTDGWTVAAAPAGGGKLIAIALLAFEDEAGAAKYVQELEALLKIKDVQLRSSPSITVKSAEYSQGVGKDAKREGVHCRKVIGVKAPTGEQEQIVTVHGTHVGRIAVEFTSVQMEWTREKEDELLESLLLALGAKAPAAKEPVGSVK